MAATATLISIEEYLRTTSEPDCEYVAGVIELRTPAELDHSSWQTALCVWFADREAEWNLRALPSLRVRVSADRFRVPDVTLLSRSAPREQIITHPPLAVFEILSPEDSMTRILEKLASDPPVVGTPVLDALLDLLAVQIMFQRLLGQLHHLVIGGKAQADQLVLGEAIDLRVPFRRGQRLQAHPLLQPDDAVLHLERIGAQLEEGMNTASESTRNHLEAK
jgi:hypothetical protein